MCTSHPLVKTFASFVLFKTRSQEPLRFSSLARITSPLFQHDSNLGGVRFKCNWKRHITYSRWRYENKVKLHSTYISTVKNKGIVYVGFNSDFGESGDLNYTQQCQGFLLASPQHPLSYFLPACHAEFHQSFSRTLIETKGSPGVSTIWVLCVAYINASLFSTKLLFNRITWCSCCTMLVYMKGTVDPLCINWIINSRIFWFWIFKAR